MYELEYWFEHGGFCLWSNNNETREKYGYAVDFRDLPISNQLINELKTLENEYGTILNWDEPNGPLLWNNEKKQDFVNRATVVYDKLTAELQDEYYIYNEIFSCVPFD